MQHLVGSQRRTAQLERRVEVSDEKQIKKQNKTIPTKSASKHKQTQRARRTYLHESRALAGRERALAGLLADAARTESSLEQARA